MTTSVSRRSNRAEPEMLESTLLGIAGVPDLVAKASQLLADDGANRRLVFHDENALAASWQGLA